MNKLPEAKEHKELLIYTAVHRPDHLRDACRIFEKLVNPNEFPDKRLVLDVGCCDATLRDFFISKGFSWVGVDKDPKTLNVMKASMEDMPFPDSSFDVVFSSHALEHTETPIAALREMCRVAKPGGLLFIVTPICCDYHLFKCDKSHLLVPTKDQMRRLFEYIGVQPMHVDEWNAEGQEDRFGSLVSMGKVVR